jgi:hypothetical protein
MSVLTHHEAAVSLGEVVREEVLDEALGVALHAPGEDHLGLQDLWAPHHTVSAECGPRSVRSSKDRSTARQS